MRASFRLASILVLVALSVSACGRRGALEPPPGGRAMPGDEPSIEQAEQDRIARQQPVDRRINRDRGSKPFQVPDRPFILDPLL